jgi:hypothetical protein
MTIQEALLLLIAICSVGHFIVLMLLYWTLIVSPSKRQAKPGDKGWV